MDDFQKLLDKLRKIEALHKGATTDGERIAALHAHEKLRERLREAERTQVTEWRFSIHDPWKRRLFIALCRKHGHRPYSYYRQRRSTVMLRASNVFVDEVLWPEYEAMSDTLEAYLDEITTRVIHEVLGQSDDDIPDEGGYLPE